jgi:hypothetical protein
MYNSKSRHIHRRYNIVKYLFLNGILFTDYVQSKKNIVDSLIKGLSGKFMYNSSRRMRLKLLKVERV